MEKPEFELKKTIQKDGVYVCQSDLLILISYMQKNALSLECRKKMQQLLEVIAETNPA